MNEREKITAGHLARQAIVYLRQSSAAQVEHNRKSTERQYALASKARELGWPNERVLVIDEDLGLSGSGAVARSGFARLTAEVALARVGLVLGLEVSRLARNNADWTGLLPVEVLRQRDRLRRHELLWHFHIRDVLLFLDSEAARGADFMLYRHEGHFPILALFQRDFQIFRPFLKGVSDPKLVMENQAPPGPHAPLERQGR